MTATVEATAPSRGVLYLLTSVTSSTLGSSATDIAIPIIAAVSLHASSFEIAALVAAEQAGWLSIGLIAGALIDRWPRRRVLVTADVVRAGLLLTLALCAATGNLSLLLLFAAVVVSGLCTVFFSIAYSSYLPFVVQGDALVAANSRLTAGASTSDFAGRSLGGLLANIAKGSVIFLCDGVSYLVSAACLSRLPAHAVSREPTEKRPPLSREIRKGLAYTFANPTFRAITASNAVINFCVASEYAVTVVFLIRTLHVDSAVVGVLFAVTGVGGLAGSVLTPRLSRRLGDGALWRCALLAAPCVGLLVPLATPGWGTLVFVVGAFGLAAALAPANIISGSYRQNVCPPELIGRMSASSRVITWSVISVGALVAGAIASASSPRDCLFILSFVLFLAPLILSRSPLWRLQQLDYATVP